MIEFPMNEIFNLKKDKNNSEIKQLLIIKEQAKK